MPKTDLVRPSRDGDQFHYLWAARRCLRLLHPKSGLVAISVEAVSPSEQEGAPATEAGTDVIDLAEYWGAEELESATRIRYLQLKHSTLHPEQPWTASGLEKTIRGFAERYAMLRKDFSPEDLAAKIEFRYVTNRPIAKAIAEAVLDAANGNSARHPKELEKLERFTGLSGSALNAFAGLLHLDAGQHGYWEQRNILHQEVQGYLPGGDADGPLRMKELVTRRATSEGEANPTINKMDVLRALGTEEHRLFPAPCLIASPPDELERAQEAELLSTIIEAAHPLVVHADAGVGKSVLASRIGRGLPCGSATVLYDCYGNGLYRNIATYRHRHRDALVQISNELAAEGLCHPLIPNSAADASDYMRAFNHRIGQAAAKLKLSDPAAVLALVIDAADNAQMAAEEIGEARSFVRDLIRQSFPDNVRLILLCRTHRQDLLDPPPHTIRIELQPFSREETGSHLSSKFSDCSQHDIDEFHRLSSQNPRVQALGLSKGLSLPETLRALGPNPTSVAETIKQLLQNAVDKLLDECTTVEREQINRICEALATLRPFVPISVLSEMSAVEPAAISSFVIELGRPLLLSGDAIQFFDEPAETWFRERFRPSPAELDAFVSRLKPLATGSAYAASVLPQLMLEAGNFTDLVDLALSGKALPETSDLERREIELRRIQFALKAGLRTRRYVDSAKLALRAGGQVAGDERQRNLLQNNTDLASEFLDLELIQELVSRDVFGSGWLGSHNAYQASIMSARQELQGDARSRLRMAHEWLQNWSRLSDEERESEQVSHQDIAELTLAHLNVHGAARAVETLNGWRPRSVMYDVARIVGRRLIDHGRMDDIKQMACSAGNNLCLVLGLCVELSAVLKTPDVGVVRRAMRLVSSKRIDLSVRDAWDSKEYVLEAVTSLVEGALLLEVCSVDDGIDVLTRYLPKTPPRGLSHGYSKSRSVFLRAYTLRSALRGEKLTGRDLAHPELLKEMDKDQQHSKPRELYEFDEHVTGLLPFYRLRAAGILGQLGAGELEGLIEEANKASNASTDRYASYGSRAADEKALLWMEVLHRAGVFEGGAWEAFFAWKRGLKRALFTPTLNALSRFCGRTAETQAEALQFALEAFNLHNADRSDADSIADGYMDCARSVLAFSPLDAKAFFDDAVAVSSRVGNENLSRWAAIVDLADRAASSDRPVPQTAYNFARCAELTYQYVARDKHFDWSASVRALSGLCPKSALTISSRWRDREFGWHKRVFPLVVQTLVDQEFLHPLDAAPLIAISGEWDAGRLTDQILNACPDRKNRKMFGQHLFKYMKFSADGSQALFRAAEAHSIEIDGLESIATRATQKAATENARELDRNSDWKLRTKSAKEWDAIFEDCDVSSVDGISRAYSRFRDTEPPLEHDQFFKELLVRVSIGSEPDLINAISDVVEFEAYQFRSFLEQVPSTWKERPATKKALAQAVRTNLRRRCLEIARSRYYQILPFDLASELSGASEAELAATVLDAVGDLPDLLDSDRLFSLIGLLAPNITDDEALSVLEYGLQLFDSMLEDTDADGSWANHLQPPNSGLASLAGHLWSVLASPDAVERWEAAHVVRGIVELGRVELLAELVKLADGGNSNAFFDATLPAYELHAKQWFLIGIARAAVEHPQALKTHFDTLFLWATEGSLHIMMREFAKRAALSLVKQGVVKATGDQEEFLNNINCSPFEIEHVEEFEHIRQSESKAEPEAPEDRYFFGIDFGPYWLAPLGRVFGLSQKAVEARALKIIREELGATSNGRWDEDPRANSGLYQSDRSMASHGSYPRVDVWSFYLSYHAMMLLAGQLLRSEQTISNPNYGEEDEWASWLERHDIARNDGRWLSDRRDTEPELLTSWKAKNRDDQEYVLVTSADFIEALFTGERIVVDGDWSTANPERQQNVHVVSALVDARHADALTRALSSAKDHMDYCLPNAGSVHEIKHGDFGLRGWISYEGYRGGLDDFDRWAGGIAFPASRPADGICGRLKLRPDEDQRTWTGPNGSVLFSSEVWGHFDEKQRSDFTSPERGQRLLASRAAICELLSGTEEQLIVEVRIDRHRVYRPYQASEDEEKERVRSTRKIFLVNERGEVRTH